MTIHTREYQHKYTKEQLAVFAKAMAVLDLTGQKGIINVQTETQNVHFLPDGGLIVYTKAQEGSNNDHHDVLDLRRAKR